MIICHVQYWEQPNRSRILFYEELHMMMMICEWQKLAVCVINGNEKKRINNIDSLKRSSERSEISFLLCGLQPSCSCNFASINGSYMCKGGYWGLPNNVQTTPLPQNWQHLLSGLQYQHFWQNQSRPNQMGNMVGQGRFRNSEMFLHLSDRQAFGARFN